MAWSGQRNIRIAQVLYAMDAAQRTESPGQPAQPVAAVGTLLAVDVGLRTGLAMFRADGRLAWYCSRNYGSRTRLRRHIQLVLAQHPETARVVLEGGGDLADAWRHEAEKRGIVVTHAVAEQWRGELLYVREMRRGPQAKRHAQRLARQVIAWAGAKRPTSLRHDAAEAILLGLWQAAELGWLDTTPTKILRT